MTNNILFSTQDSSVHVFYELAKILKKENKVDNVSFTLTNNQYYDEWIKKNNEFIEFSHSILKEWELHNISMKEDLNINLLKEYELRLGVNPGLFGAIVSDRRLFMGYKSTFTQDYVRRFNDEDLLKIIQTFLIKIDNLFKQFKPDVVVSFQCVTLTDYLLALFAREKKIKYLNLRPAKINNRVMFASTVNDPPPEISKMYNDIIDNKGNDLNFNEINSYITSYRKDNKLYEGVVKPSLNPTNKLNYETSKLRKIKNLLNRTFEYYYKYFKDNQISNPIIRLFYIGIINSLRSKKVNRFLKDKYLDKNQLKSLKYIFFPMHTEPEVSLLVHGKPFVNQIELIRMIAISMPIDTILIVKEHPWMIGKRSLNAYKKILNIPRVKIARPDMLSKDLILNSCLLTVITSSVSLEGVLLQKPCITFGDCMTNMLPDYMCQRSKDLRSLPSTISNMMNIKVDIKWDFHLRSMLYSIFVFSSRINLYTTLLGRKDRYSENKKTFHDEIFALYNCINKSLLTIEKQDINKSSLIW